MNHMSPHRSTKQADNFELPLQKAEGLLLHETNVTTALTKDKGKAQFMGSG